MAEENVMSDEENRGPTPSAQDLKSAFKAFKKRLKLAQLDDDSKIGGSPLSGGRKSEIVAITPPNQFPQAVWDELVRQGKLKKAGRGMYELAGE
jgi:hypothetical protein